MASQVPGKAASSNSVPSYQTVDASLIGQVLLLRLNRPTKKNAMNFQTYTDMTQALNFAARNASIKVVVLTGSGNFFCSGSDMSEWHDKMRQTIVKFLDTLIYYPKVLIAALNGPAVGIGTTMLMHFDLVYASESAYLHTPFISLGACPEAGSSITLPHTVGMMKANEMLLLANRMSPKDAERFGVINGVFSEKEVLAKTLEVAEQVASYSASALLSSKKFIRNESYQKIVSETNKKEMLEFFRLMSSPEFQESVRNFQERKRTQAKL